MNPRKILPAVEAAIIWLFLLQSLRVLFTSLFGVVYDAVFDQSLPFIVVGLDVGLIVLAMLTPLLLGRFKDQAALQLGATLLVLVVRIPLSLEHPTLRLYASILLLAGGALYVARLLRHEPGRLVTGLVLGMGIEQVLRALDYTYDPTLRPGGLPFVVVTSLATSLLGIYLDRERAPIAQDQPRLISGLALGAALFVQMSFLALPNALIYWSGLSYNWAAPLLLVATLLPLAPVMRALEQFLAIWFWPIGNLISVAFLMVGLLLAAWLGGSVAAILFLLIQLVFLLNLAMGVIRGRTNARTPFVAPGVETSLGFLLFLLLNLAFAFTFTYPYTLPFFRGLGTLILALGVLLSVLPNLKITIDPEVEGLNLLRVVPSLGGILALFFICLALTRPPALLNTPAGSTELAQGGGTLRLATYNIHYGFNSDWVYNLEEIAETIESQDIDVIVLQEVDAGRITSLSVDDALWLGQRLGMRVVYQPTLEKLSGIALLSRYPLKGSGGQWLTSAQEQTAIVYCVVKTSFDPLHVYGIWLGLEPDERVAQLDEVLDYISSENPAALGGDFNATPDSPIYTRLLDAGLDDPFVLAEQESALTSPAVDPVERIDYIWLRGLTPSNAWVPDSIASDHRMVVVEVELNP